MMKKTISLSLAALLALACTACKPAEEAPAMVPEETQMRAICELSVMDCYYHNVAKVYRKDAEKFLFFSKDQEFWIEYDGIVQVGVNMADVSIQVDGSTVNITLPQATVLNCQVDESSLTEDSYIVAEGSAKVSAEDQSQAFAEAQADMKAAAEADQNLLLAARQQAQQLLTDYITNINALTGQNYTIQWLDAPGESQTPPAESATASTPASSPEPEAG